MATNTTTVSSKIAGIFTPTMTPLHDDGQINEPELRRYIDWLLEKGVQGLFPNGSTGEFTRFTPEERRRVNQIACDQAAGRVPVLAGAAEANVRETLRACEACAEFGARSVAIVSPYYFHLGPGAVYAYYREVVRNSPIDVTLYNIPSFASPIDVQTVQRLAEFPRVIGIKDSSGDMGHLLRMMAAVEPSRPDFIFLCGHEAALVPMLAMGCQGATLAMSGVVPEITRKLYELTMCGRVREARALQMKFTELLDMVIFGANFPEGVRAAVELRGFKLGPSRQPPDETARLDVKGINRRIEQLLKGL
jgi:4-hydroxy-tetrahydrodipicolinate synthase